MNIELFKGTFTFWKAAMYVCDVVQNFYHHLDYVIHTSEQFIVLKSNTDLVA